MAGLRWWEPRFEGQVVREALPEKLLDALAAGAPAAGLRVVEEGTRPGRSYREAAPEHALLVEPESAAAPWERLRVWQEGPGVLRFEGSLGTWTRRLLVAWGGFAAVYIGLPLFAFRSWSAVVVAAIGLAVSVLGAAVVVTAQRRQTRRWMHAFLEGEVMRARGAVPFGLKREATFRVSHDAFAPPEDREPEDDVKPLEAAAKRGE
ncbi:MAG TPA: hypothetical protein VIF09_26550 [Polyangiaceae bacterium]